MMPRAVKLELLPCPHCKSSALLTGKATPGYVVYCCTCLAQGPAAHPDDPERELTARMAWNRRAKGMR